jgi:DNA-binding beta-propeller fold protein YncE
VRVAACAVAVAAVSLALAAGLGASGASHPQIPVGGFPTGIALNPVTHTIYVGNGTTASLSLINGRTCNARTTRGCRQRVTAVTAGTDPIGVAVERSTNTIYVVNAFGTLAIVNGRRCMAGNSSGCKVKPVTVAVGIRPQFLAVDERTHTIYVANVGSNSISVIDGRRCNATTTRGCRRPGVDIPVGPGPFTLALNGATRSLYVTVLGAPTVSILDLRDCNAHELRGCLRPPVEFDAGDMPGGIAINRKTDTIYVTGQTSNDVSVIDGTTCNATMARGCKHKPVRFAAGPGARGIAVNELTNTVYVANTAANTVSVIDGATCNGRVHSGCGRKTALAPVGISPRRIAVDELTNTVYVTNAGSNTVTMLNGRTCNGRVHRGCAKAPAGGQAPAATRTQPYTAGMRQSS